MSFLVFVEGIPSAFMLGTTCALEIESGLDEPREDSPMVCERTPEECS
jgi:hypothetical protein